MLSINKAKKNNHTYIRIDFKKLDRKAVLSVFFIPSWQIIFILIDEINWINFVNNKS